jgi:hypothetical protein
MSSIVSRERERERERRGLKCCVGVKELNAVA